MKIIRAEYAGFCFGVKRAVELAEKTAKTSENKVYSYGEIIHNAQMVERLEEQGVHVIDNLTEVKQGKLLIRSHGVSEKVIQEAEKQKLDIVDATCPFVRKIQKIVRDRYHQGYRVIIIGDKNHPEVIGINGWCDEQADIVLSREEVEQLCVSNQPYAVVVQTTIPPVLFETLEKRIRERIAPVEIHNTICTATQERQDAALNLSKQVDAMIVIGGRKSANTKKLAEITRDHCKTYLIETKEELCADEMKNYDTVGITAGASTPDFVIEEVVRYLEKL